MVSWAVLAVAVAVVVRLGHTDAQACSGHGTRTPTQDGCSTFACAELGSMYGASWVTGQLGSSDVCAESDQGLLDNGDGTRGSQCYGGSVPG
eukprot:SAG11_NODE_28133_length_325_cov_0.690265_1_plen_91_part_10